VFSSYRKIMARKAAGEMDETGFTLIELLIVIVVLGILAGVVIFALGGVTGQSAIAACKSDGATISTALAAFNTDNPSLVATATSADLTSAPTSTMLGGPFLQSWPSASNPHYTYALSGGVLTLTYPIAASGSTPASTYGPTTYTSADNCSGVS